MEEVVLVNEQDEVMGTMEKMEAHRKGVLHRAFSLMVFNSRGELLVQKRARTKYHSPGLWTNTCCSHPRPEERIADACARRLREEMGIEVNPEFAYKFHYKVGLDQNLFENEIDHVFTAVFDGVPSVNPNEVEAWKFVSLKELREDTARNPENYTVWFLLILDHKHSLTFW
jgi:isopentenyl-diphosphate delta-isomerase